MDKMLRDIPSPPPKSHICYWIKYSYSGTEVHKTHQ